jgi:hypothetical protein
MPLDVQRSQGRYGPRKAYCARRPEPEPNRPGPRTGPPSRSPPPNSGPSQCRPRSGLFLSLAAFSAAAAGLRARPHARAPRHVGQPRHPRAVRLPVHRRRTDPIGTQGARPWPRAPPSPSRCPALATATTPTSSPCPSPEAHRGARRHRSKYFTGTHIYARSAGSLTLSRTRRRSPQELSHLPRRKSDRRIGANENWVGHERVRTQTDQLCASAGRRILRKEAD